MAIRAMRPLFWLLFLLPALAQGYEVGAYGLAGQATLYLRLYGEVAGEGGRLRFSLAPYLRPSLGEAGVSLEQLSLTWEEEAYALTLGRFPLTLGEGRLFPTTWNRPGPAGGEEGVWGGVLTGYGVVRARLGYAWGQGAFLELAWPDLRLWTFSGGGGLGATGRLGEAVVYGEATWEAGQGRGLLGLAQALWGGLLTLEVGYPWKAGLAWAWGGEGLAFQVLAGYREGPFFALDLGVGGLSLGLGGLGGLLWWRASWRGDL